MKKNPSSHEGDDAPVEAGTPEMSMVPFWGDLLMKKDGSMC